MIFEGRDAAGKGGVIKRITEPLNPRSRGSWRCPRPPSASGRSGTSSATSAQLPAAGEIVLFDRSWYNRAGVERVMGFCTEDEYREFLRSCPEFERMLIRSGIMLIKYWFSVSDEEQERRFQDRIDDPTKRWKLSPMDLESRARWVEYSKAKDEMFASTDTRQSPWWVVPSDDKRRARLNCIHHLLSMVPYADLTPEPIVLPPRQRDEGYVRPPDGRPDVRAAGVLTDAARSAQARPVGSMRHAERPGWAPHEPLRDTPRPGSRPATHSARAGMIRPCVSH